MNEKNITTPYYRIHKDLLEKNFSEVEKNFREEWGENIIFSYSVKTNNYSGLLKWAKERGWLAEVVSQAEFTCAKSVGFKEREIICNGPVKGKMLKEGALGQMIVNLDNLEEVKELCEIAECENAFINGKIGLRVNFDLESLCNGETTAGKRAGRFGICYENKDLERAIQLLRKNKIPISGLHMHTSTRTRSLNVFKELSKKVCEIANEFQLELSYIDMGGGFFGGQIVEGKPSMKEYAQVVTKELEKYFDTEKVTLILEPGACVLATAIDYVASVENIREIRGERIVTLDGTALHINPFLTERNSVYEIKEASQKIIDTQHICGCTCMEKDYFCTAFDKEEIVKGSKLIFKNAGAYTMSFNSNFIVEPPQIIMI